MRSVLAVLAFALLASPVHAWTAWQADGGRSGRVDIDPGPLDIQATFQLHDGQVHTAGLLGSTHVVTPDGTALLANDDGACVLMRWQDPLATDSTVWEGCKHGSLQGYAPRQDLLAVCTVGTASDAIFQLRDRRTGQLRFRVVPASIIPDTPDDATWSCQGVAMEDGGTEARAIVPMVASTGNEAVRSLVLAVSLTTGEHDVLYPANALTEAAPLVGVAEQSGGLGPAEFWPRVASVAEGGVAVTGIHRAGTDTVAAILWLPDESAGDGILRAAGAGELASAAATSIGPLMALRLGDDTLVIDPRGDVVQQEPMFWPERAGPALDMGLVPPLLLDSLLIVPGRDGLQAYSASGLIPEWHWNSHDRDWVVGNAVVSGQGELLLVLYEQVGDGADRLGGTALARLDGRNGDLLQWIPLPLRQGSTAAPAFGFPCASSGAPGSFCPDDAVLMRLIAGRDGTVITTSVGAAVRLGPAGDHATISRSHAYPARAEEVTISVPLQADDEVKEVIVVWGDGAMERRPAPVAEQGLFRQVDEVQDLWFTHTYAEEGDKRVAVTTVFDDGTTATESLIFYVGKTPPKELNFMQRQFSAENQDRTYGILGIAVAMAGGLYAFVFRKHRHRRIRRHLEMLDAIHERSLTDPDGARKELDAHHGHIRSLLMSGRIDDGEFRILSDRAASISQRLHRRLLGTLTSKLSPAYRSQVESAFDDGLLSRAEADQLIAAMGREKGLAPEEREHLERLLRDWAVYPDR